ncbi:septal ring lytic transglycosylase RlpA family protein [Candidatus Rariloculus sp.]|uniref:septal ring lytic transglycosylase RlpA family protein n=1 Tax=Candidatus Rariloculus sp. TaxID=3101265 RepID=UPI003D14A7BF
MQAARFATSRGFGIFACLGLSLLSACSSTGVDSSAGPETSAVVEASGAVEASAVIASSPGDVPGIYGPQAVRGNPPFYEVFGERYFVLDSGDGYLERGIASWYGDAFHGQPTSGGETYDMYAMTAAHRTLPIPMWVEVTNLGNGKRVVVKVNDRGPFVDDRVIDLSFRAAEYLEMIEEGTALVEVRALGVPGVGPVAPVAAASADAGSEPRSSGFSIISDAVAATPGPNNAAFRQIFLQVGAFAERENADVLAERLKSNGFENSFIVTVGEGPRAMHRVHIGPLESAEHTDEVNAGLRAIGVNDSRLVFGY